jgi:hypothetical protein
MDLKDKARAKEARRAAKKDENRPTKGPQIDWAQPGGVSLDDGRTAPAPAPAGTSRPVVTQARPGSTSARPGASPARPGSNPGDAAPGDQKPDGAADKPTE